MHRPENLLILLLPLATASIAEVDTSEWLCEACPFEDSYRADYDIGATYVSDNAARFGNATGYDADGGYLNVDGTGTYSSDSYRLAWRIEDLGLDSRLVKIDAGRPGHYGVRFAYSELPYRRFDSTQTIHTFSPSALELPPGWVASGTTSGFAALATSLRPQNIESDRVTAGIAAHWSPTASLQMFADYQRQTRDGIDIKSGSGFTQAALLPRPIEFATDQVDLGIRYLGDSGSLTLAYYGSYFQNRNLALNWEAPFSTVTGATLLSQAEEPDNKFQQLTLSGAYHADFWNTVIAFSLGTGRGEQDDALLSYTSNPNLVTGPLPTTSLNGQVDTRNHALTIKAQPIPRARFRLSYRYDERDNTTAINDWSRVITDILPSGETEQNVPYSFERSRLSATADYRVSKSLRLAAGYDRNVLDRDFQEVAEQTEDTGWGQVRWRPMTWLDLRARGGASRRDIDRYDESIAVSLGQNPLLRKYNLAYRYREYAELTASVSPAEVPVSVTATFYLADDSYTESRLGMTDSEESRYTADINWAISERASAYLMVGNESIDARQLGSAQFGASDWQASHDDSFDHRGIGFRWHQPDGKLDLSLGYSIGNGDTNIAVNSGGSNSSLPPLKSDQDSLHATATWRWSDKVDAKLDLRYESFTTDDWSLANVAPDTLPTVLTLGASPYDYDVWAIGISFRYYFGGRNLQLSN